MRIIGRDQDGEAGLPSPGALAGQPRVEELFAGKERALESGPHSLGIAPAPGAPKTPKPRRLAATTKALGLKSESAISMIPPPFWLGTTAVLELGEDAEEQSSTG